VLIARHGDTSRGKWVDLDSKRRLNVQNGPAGKIQIRYQIQLSKNLKLTTCSDQLKKLLQQPQGDVKVWISDTAGGFQSAAQRSNWV